MEVRKEETFIVQYHNAYFIVESGTVEDANTLLRTHSNIVVLLSLYLYLFYLSSRCMPAPESFSVPEPSYVASLVASSPTPYIRSTSGRLLDDSEVKMDLHAADGAQLELSVPVLVEDVRPMVPYKKGSIVANTPARRI